MAKRQALGRGLSALLEHSQYQEELPVVKTPEQVIGKVAGGEIAILSIGQIVANPFQPRTHFDQEHLEELASSIRMHGIIQPITVRKLSPGKYQLISGERRFRASQLAELDEVPAYVRAADDQAMLEMALVENIQRENLDAIEVAISYQRLIDECDLTQEALSQKVGKNRTTVTNFLRLLKLPAEIQVGIIEKQITMGHARALINAGSESVQVLLFRKVVNEGLSVRQTENLVQKKDTAQKSTPRALSFEQQKWQADLRLKFGKQSHLKTNDGKKGKIEISFNSEDELNLLIEKLDL